MTNAICRPTSFNHPVQVIMADRREKYENLMTNAIFWLTPFNHPVQVIMDDR